jgi:polyphosphate kinase
MALEPNQFINRELSWLEFNQRVLDEARDESLPLLERLKFLAITAMNLDEFFMVRVGGLQIVSDQGSSKTDPSGMTADEQLKAISERTHRMTVDQCQCFLSELEPALSAAGFRRLTPDQLTAEQLQFVEQTFSEEISAVLSPMAVSEADEFPLLGNQTLNLCVQLKPKAQEGEPRFALIPFGVYTRRFITLPGWGRSDQYEYILLEDVVSLFVERFFPGEAIVECVPFRLTRNADMTVREDLAADLMVSMEEVLDARKQSGCVRLEISDYCTSQTLTFLRNTLGVREHGIYAAPGPLDLAAFMRLTDVKGFDALKYESWPPQPSPSVDPQESLFETLKDRDVLLYHPFESFEPVLRLIEEAAADPDVLAIKQTLYRTSRQSPVVAALRRAAENGKYVTALVELKARFDEARNIEWAKNLEQAGVQVIYGVKGLKTHAKICVIIRREPQGIKRYVHFGTGNYNEQTARIYTDVSLMTADEILGADASSFFNSITGYSQPQEFQKIAAAPIALRDKLLELIEGEIQRKKQNQPAKILAKLNSLADPVLIEALYAASQAGIEIELNIRGICCLKPGVKGLSEKIKVVSIIDRFLEHSRIFCFHHGGDDVVYIASADWMPRNLDRRVELLIPVEDDVARLRLLKVLKSCLKDTVKGRRLKSDGSYHRIRAKDSHRSQESLYRAACNAIERKVKSQATTFQPHRPPEAE